MNANEALGLPKGSVRAIAFVGLTLTVCLMSVTAIEVPSFLSAAWGTTLGFYFGGKINGSKSDKPA